MEKSVRDMICYIEGDYLDLRALNPKHELLKYFSAYERGLDFRLEGKDNMQAEFIKRFGKRNYSKSIFNSFIDYHMVLSRSFKEYLSTLREAKNDFIYDKD